MLPAFAKFEAAGFTHVALVQVGADTQEAFISWAAEELLPALRSRLTPFRTLDDVAPSGRTWSGTTERLAFSCESLADVTWTFYRRPRFVAYEELTLNLLRDPTIDPATARQVRRQQARIGERLTSLANEVVDDELTDVLPPLALFQILRGLAIGLVLTDAVPGRARRVPDQVNERQVLLDALTALVHAHDAGSRRTWTRPIAERQGARDDE